MLIVKPIGYVLALLALLAVSAATNNCTSWSERYQTDLEGVCVCSEATCDTIYNGHLYLSGNEAGVFSTSKVGDRLTFSTVGLETTANDAADFVIDTTTTYQSIIGFGGAFTDASAINVYALDSGLQDILVDAYFGDDGLQYTLGRIPIGSTDFSLTIYSYNDVEGTWPWRTSASIWTRPRRSLHPARDEQVFPRYEAVRVFVGTSSVDDDGEHDHQLRCQGVPRR